MCGIFGSTHRLGDEKVKQVLHLLNHRGPDSQGHICLPYGDGNSVHLLHTRLAIQDLSPLGHQPMSSRNGRWWITYNGELYNHLELRRDLDISCKGMSDTETLVEYIDRFGLALTLPKLNGLFAFAALDLQEQQLYLVRDSFGIKPLYYQSAGGNLTFSSEIKPILDVCGRADLDHSALRSFLTLRYVPSPNTLLGGVSRLPAGHFLKWSLATGDHETRPYIQPVRERFEGTQSDAVLAYRACLESAIERQLISDVPVGVLLSGGVDSAIVAAMAREHSDDLTAFTVGFGEGFPDCEIEDAAETARVLGIRHESVTVTPEDLRGALAKIFLSVEEPLGTTSIMPMWYLSELARSNATVVLTGQGSDEPWGGYRRYQIELIMAKYPWLSHQMFNLPDMVVGRFGDEGIRRGLRCLGKADKISRFREAYSLFDDVEITRLVPQATDFDTSSMEYWLDWLGEEGISEDEVMMRIDTRMNLADDLLLYGDKVSMAFALEARVPMLDAEVVRLVESLPTGYRTSMAQTKIVHKEMAENYLPASIVHRRKKGFQVPFGEWSRTTWREYIQSQLLDDNRKLHSIVDKNEVERLWQAHLRQKPDYSRQLFALLMLSGWSEAFL